MKRPPSAVTNLHKMMEFPHEGVFSKVVAKGVSSNHTLMCLAGGTDISGHTSTREAALTVLQGRGVFLLKGKEIELSPGVFIFMPKNEPHALRAEENLAFLLSLSGEEG